MKKILLMLPAVLMASMAFAQDGEPKTITLTDAERQLVVQNSDFAFNLFRKTRDTVNHVISPLSVTYALGMLDNGADGVTREEICQVLSGGRETGYADVATMNAFCRKMLTESALLDEDTRVAIANSIFFNGDRGDVSLKTAFKDSAATYYNATPAILNFSDEATLGTVNQWASDRTDGMIGDLLKPGDLDDPNLVSLLLNAICFKGAWGNPFDEAGTRYSYFDGKKRTAMMMAQTNAFRYAVNQLYQSIILPYGNGSYQMTVFLPCWDKTLDDVVDALNGENWNAADYQDSEVVLRMPRIETDTEQDLVDVMASLGMENAFTKYGGHGFLDFCYVGDDEANSDACWISMMRQKAHLKLDEKGTEAAAATVVELAEAGMPQYAEFVADRPFLYVISERSTGSIFFIGQYMGEPLENPRHDITLTEEEKQLVEGNNSFAFNFFRKTRGEESSILSPLSVTYALGMLNNGAAGQTQQEICDVLGFGQAGADAINQFCRKMLTEAPTLDKKTAAEIANTIYVNSGLGCELQQGFVDKANEYYDAQPETRNFYDGVTWEVINQWADDHTHGMVPKVFANEYEFNPNVASYLLNALYFKGAWTKKFREENTIDEPFQGSTSAVPMMNLRDDFLYTENDLYQAIRLPYGNEAYVMTVFLPRQGKTIGDVLATMDGHNWRFQNYSQYQVDLSMPRFKTNTDISLEQAMRELGMPTAFTDAADFSHLGNGSFFIGDLRQIAAINLDEEGTEAAAVTVIEVATGMPRQAVFHANRPFFYTISERSTGCIFFIGQFLGDATAGISRTEATNKTAPNVVFDLQGRRINGQWKKGLYIVDGKKVVVN